MGLRGPQPTGRTTDLIRLKKDTIKAIRRLSHETGKSQSEVVDMAMVASRLLDLIARTITIAEFDNGVVTLSDDLKTEILAWRSF